MRPARLFSGPRLIATILIGLVFLMNVQAGLDFYFRPQVYVSSYQLSGTAGELAIAGFGLLFIMWNVPYAFAVWNPSKNKKSLVQAVIMQAIGCLGETVLLLRLPGDAYLLLKSSITHFIVFDSAGLVFLLAALLIINRKKDSTKPA
jgi:hypothetical protein